MRTTAKGLALIKEFEGLRLEAYICLNLDCKDRKPGLGEYKMDEK